MRFTARCVHGEWVAAKCAARATSEVHCQVCARSVGCCKVCSKGHKVRFTARCVHGEWVAAKCAARATERGSLQSVQQGPQSVHQHLTAQGGVNSTLEPQAP